MPDPKPKRVPRNVTVRRVADLGPHFRRITLGGPELAGFPADSHGSYIKLLIPKPPPPPPAPEAEAGGAAHKSAADAGTASGGEHFVRTYTIRHHRPDANELDLDIVLHAAGENTYADGPGAAWARAARPATPSPSPARATPPSPTPPPNGSSSWATSPPTPPSAPTSNASPRTPAAPC
jgi:NADPH-dependent ferric siderophore reductase